MLLEIDENSSESNWMSVVKDIAEVSPDIVVMQEIPIDGDIVRLFEEKLYEMGYDSQYKAYSKDPNAKLGIMVASWNPIIESNMLDLGNRRVLADVKIKTGLEDSLNILGTHLEVSSSEVRQKEARQLLEYIQKRGYQKFILTGDFNAKWDSPEIQVLRKANDLFQDSFDAIEWDVPNYTCWSGSRIDYMFLGPQSRHINGTYVYHGSTSDHLPLILDIWTGDTGESRYMMLHLALFILLFMLLLYAFAALYAPPSTWNRAYQFVEGYDDEY